MRKMGDAYAGARIPTNVLLTNPTPLIAMRAPRYLEPGRLSGRVLPSSCVLARIQALDGIKPARACHAVRIGCLTQAGGLRRL